jgi:hypothetical protein
VSNKWDAPKPIAAAAKAVRTSVARNDFVLRMEDPLGGTFGKAL